MSEVDESRAAEILRKSSLKIYRDGFDTRSEDYAERLLAIEKIDEAVEELESENSQKSEVDNQ